MASVSAPIVGGAAVPTPHIQDEIVQEADLSPAEFRLYNKMAAGMDAFHAGFRTTWTSLYDTCSSETPPSDTSNFLKEALEWCAALDQHHAIEEKHVFPKLAKKMSAFQRPDDTAELSAIGLKLLEQHKQIHAGLDLLHEYLKTCQDSEPPCVDIAKVKLMFDSFGTILWQHMDDEVDQMRADNMRKYWTVEEMRALPFKE